MLPTLVSNKLVKHRLPLYITIIYKFILCEAFFWYEMLTTQTTVTCHKQICYKLIFRLSGCETHLSSKCIKISNGKIYIGHYNTIPMVPSILIYKWDVFVDKMSLSIECFVRISKNISENISVIFNALIDCRCGLIYINVPNTLDNHALQFVVPL